MDSLHYLTVQDILWINLQVTKKVQHFNYAKLEEATFYQYAYGESNTLLPQAARFITGFLKMHPFDSGNEGTALVGCLAFLSINDYKVKDSADLTAWFARISSKQTEGAAAIEEIAEPDSHAHHTVTPDIRTAVRRIMDRHKDVLGALTPSPERQTA